LVGLERCDLGPGGGVGGLRNRGWGPAADTRVWAAAPHSTVRGAVTLRNNATGRCLQNGTTQGLATVVLMPCDAANAAQAWAYGPNAATVAALVHNETGLALAVGNSTLFSAPHGGDPLPVNDAAYGTVALGLAPYEPTQPCTTRNCEGYHPEQLWYGPDAVDGFISQATYVASINHCFDGDCYELTAREPSHAHQCL